ncbi:MAG: hypothetical protein K8R90_04430 [Candidatus Cloacimonetes bacterium]|nr:hypothetical protein [Candidatus Cloacimonadota bacterium]
MTGMMKVKDTQGHTLYIVPAKIREVFIAMGNVVIVWDNGNKRTIETSNAKALIEEIIAAVEDFYHR